MMSMYGRVVYYLLFTIINKIQTISYNAKPYQQASHLSTTINDK